MTVGTTRDRRIAGAALVLSVALLSHYRAVWSNPTHRDETDWSARAYFYRLAFFEHNTRHWLWVAGDGIDQPHVTDFLIGASFHLAGQAVPGVPQTAAAWANGPAPSGVRLRVARAPGAILGSLAALAVFWIGAVSTGRTAAGLLAGLLYTAHPLALGCQPRAMSDGPLLFFSASAVALVTWSFDRGRGEPAFPGPYLVSLALGPVCLGLAIGCKLTGIFTALSVILFYQISLFLNFTRTAVRHLACFVLLTAVWTVLVNPTLHSQPVPRFRAMFEHRWRVAMAQCRDYPESALTDPGLKIRALYWHLSGGHGPWSSWAVVGLATAGFLAVAVREAVRVAQRKPVTPAMPTVVWAVVLVFGMAMSLPLSWNRYYLPLLPPFVVSIAWGATLASDFLLTARASKRGL